LSCANNSSYSKYETEYPHPDTTINERYEKRIVKQNKDTVVDLVDENNEGNTKFTEKNLNDISYQKLKQFFEMMNFTGKEREKELQEYTYLQARKFWVNPTKSDSIWQNKKLKEADSISIISFKQIDFQENNNNIVVGNYLLTLKTYKKGKENNLQFHTKILFEIIELALDGKVYNTIKTKIISIE
jgi:hypothetical protein